RSKIDGRGQRGKCSNLVALVRGADGENVRIERREVRRVAAERVVAGCGHDERARPEREPDRVVEQRVVVLTAEAEIDYAGPAPGRLVDPLDRSALVEKAEGARIPHTQDGVGVDPDDPDAVVRPGGALRPRTTEPARSAAGARAPFHRRRGPAGPPCGRAPS